MKVLVTGGTGFVGTHLVNALLRRQHEVAVLERREGAARNRYNHPVEPVLGDVLDRPSLERAAAGRDAVVHLVGIIHEKRRSDLRPDASGGGRERRRPRWRGRGCADSCT